MGEKLVQTLMYYIPAQISYTILSQPLKGNESRLIKQQLTQIYKLYFHLGSRF